MRKLRVRSLLCLSLACATLLSMAPVHAAPSGQSDDATVAIARERFKEGVAFFDKKEFDKARVAFLQAYALKKHPAVLLNLAQSELRSSHEADAAKHFAAYLREASNATDGERQAAEAGLNATKSAVAEIAVSVDEGGAEVYLDGSLEGLSPLPGSLYVTSGSHSVEARKAGKSTALQLNASPGKQLHADLTFATKPPPIVAVAPGPTPSSEAAPEPTPPSEPSGGRKPFFKWLVSSPVGWVGLGLTGVGVGSGIGFSIASKKNYDNADSIAAQITSNAKADAAPAMASTSNLCTDPKAWLNSINYATSGKTPDFDKRVGQYQNACAKYPDATKNGDTMKTIATVGFVVGGVAAVGTVIYYFIDPNAVEGAKDARHAVRRRLALVPSVGPQTGLTLVGSF